ncbi:MAG: DegT/DnrJ/EryC1/StrS family aminotransferase [Acidobacteriaceae bacterium]|nr:DegT/DnrJ/EryC1/StrS family aminotransferase [Acidobacteriaceae bacterium]MBV9782136.1 DegT/DnrJ/EryC1/StrS family aminotransferase [Acidobacteriaceae bacterium]
MNIPLSSPDISGEDRAAVLEVLDSGDLSLGPKLPAFEQAIAQVANSRHAIAVNSGTSGLHLCVRAAGIQDGDEVITSPFSFVASANCVLFERGRPVFVDIDPVTYNLDPRQIEQAITPRTKAILPVHLFGRPCEMDPIMHIARQHGLAVIEDACEAIGAEYHGLPVGTFGQTGVFAFYPNKQLTTGEGGIIITDDDETARLCRVWRNQGRSETDDWLEHDELGYNYRLSDINCALGLSQISRLRQIMKARQRVADLYETALEGISEVIPPAPVAPHCRASWFVYVIRLSGEFDRAQRDQVIAALRRRGIGCRNYFPPIHLQPLYQRLFGYRPGDFPITERISDRTIALPFFNRLSEGEIDFVCAELQKAVHSLGAEHHMRSWGRLQTVP